MEPGFPFTGEALRTAKGTQGERDALREVKNRGTEIANPLRGALLGTYSRNGVSSRDNPDADSSRGGSRYTLWLRCLAPLLLSTLVELLTSDPAPEIVIASCLASSRPLFLSCCRRLPCCVHVLNRSPTRLSATVCGGILDPGGCDALSFCAPRLGPNS